MIYYAPFITIDLKPSVSEGLRRVFNAARPDC